MPGSFHLVSQSFTGLRQVVRAFSLHMSACVCTCMSMYLCLYVHVHSPFAEVDVHLRKPQELLLEAGMFSLTLVQKQ